MLPQNYSENQEQQPLRQWSMKSMSDWAYWTSTMTRIVITLIIVGLLPHYINCDSCNAELDAQEISPSNTHTALPKIDEGWGYYCSNCKKYYSLRKNTLFHKSKKSLKCWITAIYIFSIGKKGMAEDIVRETQDDKGWSERRVYPIIHYLRNCVARFYNDNFPILGENGKTVQIDEAAHSKKHKFHVGLYFPIRWVFGMVEEGTGWCKFWFVPDRTRNTLIPLIQAYVAPGARINSDWWLAYQPLAGLGYRHYRISHAFEFVCRLTGATTNLIECMWKHTKEATIRNGGCLDEHLQVKLDVYAFRTMWLKNKSERFRITCKAISETYMHYNISDFQ